MRDRRETDWSRIRVRLWKVFLFPVRFHVTGSYGQRLEPTEGDYV